MLLITVLQTVFLMATCVLANIKVTTSHNNDINREADSGAWFGTFNWPWNETPSIPGPSEESWHMSIGEYSRKSTELSGLAEKVGWGQNTATLKQLSNHDREWHTGTGIRFLASSWPQTDTSSLLGRPKEAGCEHHNTTASKSVTMVTKEGKSLIGVVVENPPIETDMDMAEAEEASGMVG